MSNRASLSETQLLNVLARSARYLLVDLFYSVERGNIPR